jgi:ribonucleoside-diphosphate reductase alpha chain
VFALAYKRSNVLEGQTLYETNPLFLEYLDRADLDAERVISEVLEKGRLKEVSGVPDDLKRLFVTALEISPQRHLQIQAAFQKYVNNSVSKTINLPADATTEDVAVIYRTAWKMGLKGITIYRYGSKAVQVMELGVGEEPQQYEHTVRCDPEECRL